MYFTCTFLTFWVFNLCVVSVFDEVDVAKVKDASDDGENVELVLL